MRTEAREGHRCSPETVARGSGAVTEGTVHRGPHAVPGVSVSASGCGSFAVWMGCVPKTLHGCVFHLCVPRLGLDVVLFQCEQPRTDLVKYTDVTWMETISSPASSEQILLGENYHVLEPLEVMMGISFNTLAVLLGDLLVYWVIQCVDVS